MKSAGLNQTSLSTQSACANYVFSPVSELKLPDSRSIWIKSAGLNQTTSRVNFLLLQKIHNLSNSSRPPHVAVKFYVDSPHTLRKYFDFSLMHKKSTISNIIMYKMQIPFSYNQFFICLVPVVAPELEDRNELCQPFCWYFILASPHSLNCLEDVNLESFQSCQIQNANIIHIVTSIRHHRKIIDKFLRRHLIKLQNTKFH